MQQCRRSDRVYLPANEVEVDGIIRFPLEYNPKDLLNDECYGVDVTTRAKIEILETFRLNSKRIEEDSHEKVPVYVSSKRELRSWNA